MSHDYDYILVGGGLHNGLTALFLAARQPSCSVLVVERDLRLGGNHTWCFHSGDLNDEARELLAPLIEYSWPGYEVRFPDYERRIEAPYCGFTGTALHDALIDRARVHEKLTIRLGSKVVEVGTDFVVLESGERLAAREVIDSRGPVLGLDSSDPQQEGYQVFLGREVELASPHGVSVPVVMDATVTQSNGFRFVYVLPLSPTRLLVEDTYFSNSPALDTRELGERIDEYIAGMGAVVLRCVRTESGVLPLPWQGEIADVTTGVIRGGYAGGWFHPTTGYSFPLAARFAEAVAATLPGDSPRAALSLLANEHSRQQRFLYRLNRMMFRWYPPNQRRGIMQRFYRLPEATVRRFYAASLKFEDRVRILVGRPPPGLRWSRAFGFSRSDL